LIWVFGYISKEVANLGTPQNIAGVVNFSK